MNSIKRTIFITASAVCLLMGTVNVQAQSLFADEERMDELALEMQSISSSITSSMQETQSAIQALLNEDGKAGVDSVRAYFDSLENQARTILSQVSVNSNFMDALDAADRRLQVMQRRFEADVEASGGSDGRALQRLERIQKARADFDTQMKMVRETESDIVELILENSEARDELIIEGSLDDAERVVAALSKVTSGLQAAAGTLQEISQTALNRDDVASIATE